MKPKNKNKTYDRSYDTTEESKLSPFQISLRNRITLHPVMKKVKMQDPDFASTDAQRFLQEYERKKFRKKVKNIIPGEYFAKDVTTLPLKRTNDLLYKNNAFYDGLSFQYNGNPTNENFPTFANVIAHEAGHQIDKSYFSKINGERKHPSDLYAPLIDNNAGVYNLRKHGRSNIVENIKNDDANTYITFHDYYPSEIFADIMADKYAMNVAGIYNSLGNIPFTTNDYDRFSKYLKQNYNKFWSRGMRQLIIPGKNYDLPDAEIYTRVMNDL